MEAIARVIDDPLHVESLYVSSIWKCNNMETLPTLLVFVKTLLTKQSVYWWPDRRDVSVVKQAHGLLCFVSLSLWYPTEHMA